MVRENQILVAPLWLCHDQEYSLEQWRNQREMGLEYIKVLYSLFYYIFKNEDLKY